VSAKVPLYTASGQYKLTSVRVNVADLSREYSFPQTLHQEITINVVNDKKDPIPELKNVTLEPAK
jgi:hypothetical protein